MTKSCAFEDLSRMITTLKARFPREDFSRSLLVDLETENLTLRAESTNCQLRQALETVQIMNNTLREMSDVKTEKISLSEGVNLRNLANRVVDEVAMNFKRKCGCKVV